MATHFPRPRPTDILLSIVLAALSMYGGCTVVSLLGDTHALAPERATVVTIVNDTPRTLDARNGHAAYSIPAHATYKIFCPQRFAAWTISTDTHTIDVTFDVRTTDETNTITITQLP